MKKVFIILVAFLSLFLFTSCNSEEEQNENTFSGVLGCYYYYGRNSKSKDCDIYYGDYAIEKYSHYLATIVDNELIMPDYFEDCPITNFYFVNKEDIGKYGVTKIRVGENISYIYGTGCYNNSFVNCSSIKGVYIPENVDADLSGGLGISNLEELTILSHTDYNWWPYLNDQTKLKKLTIGKNTSLGNYCNSIRDLHLEEIIIPEDNVYYYTLDNKTIYSKGTNNLLYPLATFISNKMVIKDGIIELTTRPKNIDKIEEVILPNSIEKIGDSFFEDWPSLKTITLNDGLKEIGARTFYGCSNLESIVIPDSVEKIGKLAFGNLLSLQSVTIGKNATFEDNPFFGDYYDENLAQGKAFSKLEEIKVSNENENYDSRDNCNALIDTKTNTILLGTKNTIIPSTVTSIGKFAFVNSSIEGITIPGNVKIVGDYAFINSILKNVLIESGVESIGKTAFAKCKNLTNIELPDTITTVGGYAFFDCINLVSVKLSNNLDKISNGMFYGDVSLTTMNMSSNIKSIQRGAFDGCRNYSLSIGTNVLEVYINAIVRVESVTYDGTMEEFNNILFNNDKSLIINVICSDGTFVTNQEE